MNRRNFLAGLSALVGLLVKSPNIDEPISEREHRAIECAIDDCLWSDDFELDRSGAIESARRRFLEQERERRPKLTNDRFQAETKLAIEEVRRWRHSI